MRPHCPDCGSTLAPIGGTDAPACPNPDCPPRIRAALAHWCAPEAMNLAQIGNEFLDAVVTQGLVRDVADLYRLRRHELLQFPGVTEAAADAFLAALESSRQCGLGRVLAGLDIPGLGSTAAGALASAFATWENLQHAPEASVATVPGVGPELARALAAWAADGTHRRLLKRLRQAGVSLATPGNG